MADDDAEINQTTTESDKKTPAASDQPPSPAVQQKTEGNQAPTSLQAIAVKESAEPAKKPILGTKEVERTTKEENEKESLASNAVLTSGTMATEKKEEIADRPVSPMLVGPTEESLHPESAVISRRPTPMEVERPQLSTTPQPMPLDESSPHGNGPSERPLNVTDALSYLDAVKNKFHDQPDVYNHFLDIMKEFKSQQIDTPGVIKRVSALFQGHPSLIQGFNTFLPAGYRIECSVDANHITVTTPRGTTMETTGNLRKGSFMWSDEPVEPPVRHSERGLHPSSHRGTPDPTTMLQLQHSQPQAIEPAVAYVQKIKQRCDPETYRQFLDILSRYHHAPDTIDEEEVSKQIARLFKDAPDLRSDFRIFMPERSQSLLDDTATAAEESRHHRVGTPTGDMKGKRKHDLVTSNSRESLLPQKRKRKAPEREKERERELAAVKSSSSSKVKKLKPEASSSSSHRHSNVTTADRRNHHAPPPLPSMSRPPIAIDETHFFDRVKRALDSRETYNEFLKVVNLFTQGFIDSARLVKESRNFLVGDGELMRQFKEILGWDDKKEKESWAFEAQQQQAGWTRPTIVGGVRERPLPGRVDLSVQYGSYRRLPASEINVTCSGRDNMCRSVLNDEWVSHPTWGSEDTGFSVNKKNIYEEALHRSEEERHEYDFHIEAIVRTIAILEPINNKIAQLSQDERGGFKLKPNLGGSAKAIHQRVIKKIYGREAGLEVIQSMQDTPALAIPVVLARLKQKEEEWKRAQREWNKVWREVDARNYAKSLDHQSISFKAADKKALTTKSFVNQIEAAREEQMTKRASLIDPLFARTRPRHQLEFVVDEAPVLQDALKLIFSFLDRTQGQIHFAERRRIEGFLRSFVPLFFVLDPVAFNSAFLVAQEAADTDLSDDGGSVVDDLEVASVGSGSSRTGGRSRKGGSGISGGDLRKKLLKSEQAKSTNRKTRAQEAASPSISRFASPAPPLDDEARGEASGTRKTPKKCIFFTSTVFYTLLRLLEVLYSRLALFKSIAAKRSEPDSHGQTPVASTLGLPPPTGLNLDDRKATSGHYYDLLLESCERLFDNELEQAVFEDQVRFMFGIKDAYKIFTVDKLIGVIIKQVQAVFADAKSQELLEVLKRDRALVSPTTQDQINSRRSAEKVLGPDENLFRIDWLPDSRTMTIQLIGKDDSSFDDSEVLTGRWQAYIDSYVSSETTQGVSSQKIRRPFLRKNLPRPAPDTNTPLDVVGSDGLEIKVCVRTYRMFFVSDTEDYLCTIRNKDTVQAALPQIRTRQILRQRWLERSRESGFLVS